MSNCEDDSPYIWEAGFNIAWWWIALILSGLFTIYVCYDFICHTKSRATPSKLMLGRILSNFAQILIFFITVSPHSADDGNKITECTNPITCHLLGGIFTISLIVSISYYASICIDLYLTITNPFRKPAANSIYIHFIVWIISSILVIPIGFLRPFIYRNDYQFCWINYPKDRHFASNIIIRFVPPCIVIIAGIYFVIWLFKRLKIRMKDDTFELRWKIMIQQTGIVACFTINYINQSILWMAIFSEPIDKPTKYIPQPYLLSAFVFHAVLFDFMAWCAKDLLITCCGANISSLSSDKPSNKLSINDNDDAKYDEIVDIDELNNKYQSEKPNNNNSARPMTAREILLEKKFGVNKEMENVEPTLSSTQNLSNALCREVITLITDGLVTSIKYTARQTQKKNLNKKPSKSTIDVTNIYNNYGTINDSLREDEEEKYDKIAKPFIAISFSTKRRTKKSTMVSNASNDTSISMTSYYTMSDDDDSISSTSSNDHDKKPIAVLTTHKTTDDDMDIHKQILKKKRKFDTDNDNTLGFDYNDDEEDVFSNSLLETIELEPSSGYFPKKLVNIKSLSKHKNRGIINCFNIGDNDDNDDNAGNNVLFTDYAPHVFRYLRTKIFGVSDNEYLESIFPGYVGGDVKKISDGIIAKFSEGRSGAFFFFSADNKYLIKTLNKQEAQLLIDTLKEYAKCMEENRKTYLTKYYGLHSIKLYSKTIYFIVNGNVFPAEKKIVDKIKEKYDIKGSWIDRHTKHHIIDRKLMKDEDLNRKLELDPIISTKIHNQLIRDTEFLQKQNIMDYSLLLGIRYEKLNNKLHYFGIDENDEQDANGNDNHNEIRANVVEGPGVYYIGIIDMLQSWNLNKKLESFVKVYFRCKEKHGISCVDPEFYRRRFLKKMDRIGI